MNIGSHIRRKGASFVRFFTLLMAGTALASVMVLDAATAQAMPPARAGASAGARDLNIPPQSLASALIAFSRQTRLQIFIDQELASGKSSPGVSGALAPSAALDRLLTGTGLTHRFTNPNTVSIERPAATAGGNPASGAIPLDTIDVQGRNPNAVIGNLPVPYAGGQVATGGQLGLLGNRDVMDVPFNITSYTSKTIQDQQAQTVGDVLMNDPSVRSVYPRGGNTDEFMIRGFTLYNREIAFNGLYGLVPFSSVGLVDIERVEVLKGPNALLNGMAIDGSVGGGINLVPKRAGAEPLNLLTATYVSKGQVGINADIARRWAVGEGSFGARGNVAYSSGDTAVDNSALDMQAISLGLDYSTDRVRIEGDFRYQRRNLDAPSQLLFPGTVVPAVKAPDPGTNFAQPWTYLDTTELMGMVRGEVDLSPDVTLFAAVGARKGEYDSLQSNWTLQDRMGLIRSTPFYNYSEYEAVSHQVGIRAQADTGPVRHQISVIASGVGLDTYMFSSSLPPTVFSNIYSPVAAARPAIPAVSARLSNRTNLTSVGISDTMSILDRRVQLTVGARQQQVKVTNYNTVTGAATSSYDESALTPAVGLVVKPLENLSLYANYIQGLSQGPQAPTTAVNAGEVFPPFVTEQYEMGAKIDFGGLALTVSAFQIELPNSFTDPLTRLFRVDGNQRNRGLEVMAFGEISETVRLLGGFAYTESVLTRTAGGVNDGKTGVGVPKFQANLGSEWDTPLSGLTLSGRMIYTAPQYLNAANTQEIPDWVRFDLGARYAFEANGTPITLRFSVENVFNKGYWASASRGGYKAGAPRTFLLSATADF